MITVARTGRCRAALSTTLVALCLTPVAAGAQEPAHAAWTWTTNASAFFGYNYQQRHFADFSAWESQNWWMGSGDRTLGRGRLIVDAMISLEPFTMPHQGSPQLFQTGESYQSTPLVNSQHPHDLVMALGATYRAVRPRATLVFGADLVGAPTLGPVPFMHRESARDNPQVPLTHHFMDSTHITPGVVRAGVETGGVTIEGSVFRGAEPDENRTNIERPALDSYAARLGWRRGGWSAQVSAGRLHEPEWFEPYDETRLTASVGYDGHVGGRRVSTLLGWGENREEIVPNGVSDGFLLEWDAEPFDRAAAAPWRTLSVYGRGEIAVKQIFGLGYHPKGLFHAHVYSHVDAVTLGLVEDLVGVRWMRLGVGADVTLYHMSPDLLQYYEGSHSYHVFLRWRPTGTPSAPAAHVH
jgi:hypothetical protein